MHKTWIWGSKYKGDESWRILNAISCGYDGKKSKNVRIELHKIKIEEPGTQMVEEHMV